MNRDDCINMIGRRHDRLTLHYKVCKYCNGNLTRSGQSTIPSTSEMLKCDKCGAIFFRIKEEEARLCHILNGRSYQLA